MPKTDQNLNNLSTQENDLTTTESVQETEVVASSNQVAVKGRSKKKSLYILLIALGLAFSFFCGFFTHKCSQGDKINTIAWVINKIDQNYVVYDESTGQIKEFTAEDYADAILGGLCDKYSRYYTADEYSDLIATSEGRYYGIGVSFKSTDSTIIYSVYGNSPAYKKGIRKGDSIVKGKINGKTEVTFSNYDDISKFLNSITNEQFTLTVQKSGSVQTFDCALTKKAFNVNYVYYTDKEKSMEFMSSGDSSELVLTQTEDKNTLLDEHSAIIRLDSFEGDAGEQFAKIMQYVKGVNKTKIILDVRDNGGGYMNILTKIASHLTYNDSSLATVCYVKYKDGKIDEYKVDADNFNRNLTKICVLANENSASATECLIGAMLHYQKAFTINDLVVVNQSGSTCHTFGKGIMQTTFSKNFTGDAIKLTTAYIFQPNGKTSIHGKGIFATLENSFNDDVLALNHAIAKLNAIS